MTGPDARMDRRSYLVATGVAAAGTVGLAGCSGTATGTLATRVSDQPADIGDFESCVVTITGMWLGAESGEDDADREYYEYDEPQAADLVDLQGDASALVDERDLEVASYAFLQLDVEGIAATLNDGSEATVRVPGEAPLTFNEPFEIREATRTVFTADFTPVERGGAGGYVLQPVPREIEVDYEEPESSA